MYYDKILFGLLFIMLVSFKLNFWLIQKVMIMVFSMFIFNYSPPFLCWLSNLLGLDLISNILVLLSFWLGFLMMRICKDCEKIFIFLFSISIMFSFSTFVSLNLFLFFLSFEASLISISFIIVGWGYQPKRF